MALDSFTEVTGQSWLRRVGSSVKGVVVGLIFVIASFVLIFWNEGRTVKRYRTLNEGAGAVISVSIDSILPENEGRLVHVSGKLDSDEILYDEIFSVDINGLRLLRTAKMYQWQEHKETTTKKKLGGGTETVTTYNYKRVWSSHRINSSSFRKPEDHENPDSMKFSSREITAAQAHLGAFRVPESLVSRFGSAVPLPLAELPDGFSSDDIRLNAGDIYIGANPDSPAIGDMKISFSVVNPGMASIVAGQSGGTLVTYTAKSGGTIALIEEGPKTAAQMFEQAQSQNRTLCWILRLVAFVLMAVGFGMILKPLSVLADVIPFVGSIVGFGTGLTAFVLALVLSGVAIAIAWIAVRPMIAVGVFAVALIPVFWARTRIK